MGNSEAEIKVEYIEQKYKQVTHRENPFFGNHSLQCGDFITNFFLIHYNKNTFSFSSPAVHFTITLDSLFLWKL